MSSGSDSEEFYDAEDITPNHGARKPRKSSNESLTKRSNSEPNLLAVVKAIKEDDKKEESKSQNSFRNDNVFAVPQKIVNIGGRKKFKELRQKLQNDDEDSQPGNITPPNSQTSSVDGVFAATSKTSHPFRIIEQDSVSIQSMSSLSRIVRLGLAENGVPPDSGRKALSVSALSFSSHDSESTPSSKDYPSTLTLSTPSQSDIKTDKIEKIGLPLQEPDVIASTKSSSLKKSDLTAPAIPSTSVAPIAPPRRKKKKQIMLALTKSASSSVCSSSQLTSPTSTIESLTKELENSLDRTPSNKSSKSTKSDVVSVKRKSDFGVQKPDHTEKSLNIKEATKGQFVVKPQDHDNTKGNNQLKIDVDKCEDNKTDNSNTATPKNSKRTSVGHYSLGPHRGTHQPPKRPTNTKERRKSAGDESLLKGVTMRVRTHTDSGKHLSDMEILEQVTVLNLDTGELIPLSVAEDKLPQCINPLSLHIMRLTSEYVSSGLEKGKESDDESVCDSKKVDIPIVDENDTELGMVRKKTARLKRFLGTTVKKTMHKAKSIAQEVSHARHKEDTIDIVDVVHPGEQNIKLRASNSHKGPYDFEKTEHVQELKDEHEGPVWCMKFSCCGRLLATAGQDRVLRIWVVKEAFPFFQGMRTKYAEKVSPTPSQESLVSHHSVDLTNLAALESMYSDENSKTVFMPKPFCTYTGHTSDLLDVSWSKNYFILSSSMDKTVRLWHISRKECLCCFQHIDFVTAIVFHPRDDRYFLSGSLDGKLRLWNIPDKKVAVWNEVESNPKLITAANFCENGKFAVVGTYDGRCIFYNTDQLKYHTQIHVKSSRGRNSTGRKISGIEPMPGEDKILVTSNDSRIRLYDLRDLNVSCKYKGYVNTSSQIKASFSHDGVYVVSGSENRDIYIWKTNHDYAKFSSVRRDRNDFWEAIKAHNAVVTCAIFAPNPENIIKMIEEYSKRDEKDFDDKNKIEDPVVEQHTKGCNGYVLISADFNGCIKVFVNKMKPKHSSLPVSAMA